MSIQSPLGGAVGVMFMGNYGDTLHKLVEIIPFRNI